MTRARPRPKPPRTTRSEAEVMAQVLEAAQSCGVVLERQNTGGFTNSQGQYVACGTPGNSDLIGIIPRGPNAGKVLMIECKHEGFDPAKLSGEKKAHFEGQLARLQRTNAQGGIAFWCDDSSDFIMIMQHVLAGARVVEPGAGRPTVEYPETRRG